jgi:hypothetical protein
MVVVSGSDLLGKELSFVKVFTLLRQNGAILSSARKRIFFVRFALYIKSSSHSWR